VTHATTGAVLEALSYAAALALVDGDTDLPSATRCSTSGTPRRAWRTPVTSSTDF